MAAPAVTATTPSLQATTAATAPSRGAELLSCHDAMAVAAAAVAAARGAAVRSGLTSALPALTAAASRLGVALALVRPAVVGSGRRRRAGRRGRRGQRARAAENDTDEAAVDGACEVQRVGEFVQLPEVALHERVRVPTQQEELLQVPRTNPWLCVHRYRDFFVGWRLHTNHTKVYRMIQLSLMPRDRVQRYRNFFEGWSLYANHTRAFRMIRLALAPCNRVQRYRTLFLGWLLHTRHAKIFRMVRSRVTQRELVQLCRIFFGWQLVTEPGRTSGATPGAEVAQVTRRSSTTTPTTPPSTSSFLRRR